MEHVINTTLVKAKAYTENPRTGVFLRQDKSTRYASGDTIRVVALDPDNAEVLRYEVLGWVFMVHQGPPEGYVCMGEEEAPWVCLGVDFTEIHTVFAEGPAEGSYDHVYRMKADVLPSLPGPFNHAATFQGRAPSSEDLVILEWAADRGATSAICKVEAVHSHDSAVHSRDSTREVILTLNPYLVGRNLPAWK